MKKMKSLLMFAFMLTLFVVAFCFNASAAEWVKNGDTSYAFDKDTGVMVIRGEGATIETHEFSASKWCNQDFCDCLYNIEFDDNYNPQDYYDAGRTRTLIIESGITKIEEGAFTIFDSLETIIFPDTISVISAGTCNNLKNLKTVVLPYGLTEIHESAFRNCKNLKNINIPSTVTTIKSYAFYHCNMDYIKIPDTVKSVATGNKLIPDCIENVKPDPGNGYITLYWDGVRDASNYRVFIRENNKWKKV